MSNLHTCPVCGTQFESEYKRGLHKRFCSRLCRNRHHGRKNSRFNYPTDLSDLELTNLDLELKELERRYLEQNKDVKKKICYG